MYCERLGPGLLAEPLNAFSNLAFFVAAWFAWRLSRERDLRAIAGLIAVIGMCSALFHSLATPWAGWLDIGSILVFQLAFLWVYSRSALLVLAFLGISLYARQFSAAYSGSLTYLPALIAIAALGVHHWWSKRPEPFVLAGAAAVFAVSLALRTIDQPLCAQWPYGTHFAWHLLNALVLYLCLRALATRYGPPSATSGHAP